MLHTLILCLMITTETVSSQGAAIKKAVEDFHRAGLFAGSVLVAHEGDILYQGAHGFAEYDWQQENTLDTVFYLASLTKPFTATLIMRLVESGLIDPERPIAAYLPDLNAEWTKKITVHHLLSHTSGLPRAWRDYTNKSEHHHFTVPEILEVIERIGLDSEPGTGYAYSNIGYFLLARITEARTGLTWEQALSQQIFKPLGMSRTGVFRFARPLTGRATGYKHGFLADRAVTGNRGLHSQDWGAGGLYSTVGDLLKFDQALYKETLLKSATKERMFKDGGHEYGLGWELATLPDGGTRLIMHTGADGEGFSTAFLRLPKTRHTLIVLSNNDSLGRRHGAALVRAVLGILFGATGSVKVPDPLARNFARILFGKGVDAARAYYRELPKQAFPVRWVGPRHATGPPNSDPGESYRAWASLSGDGQREWLHLTYDPPVSAVALHVYENLGPGAIDRITLYTGDRSSELDIAKASRGVSERGVSIFQLPISKKDPIGSVRLELNSPAVSGWNMIDAVGLVQAGGETAWASDATASSTAADSADLDLFATPYRADLELWARRYHELGYTTESSLIEAFIAAEWSD